MVKTYNKAPVLHISYEMISHQVTMIQHSSLYQNISYNSIYYVPVS